MNYTLLKDIELYKHINSRIYATFMVKDVSVRLQRDQVTKFITFNMIDRDSCIEAKLFGASESQIEMIKDGKVFNAALDVKEYDKAPSGYSCIVYNIAESDLNPNQFIQWADGMDLAQTTINNALSIIKESNYWDIVYDILAKYWNKFTTWTAASSMHHNILGGLYVHTAEVIDICNELADYWNEKYEYNIIDKALVTSAALLHDVGKCIELSVDMFGNTQYSTEASLESHIMLILKEVDIIAYEKHIGYQTYKINEIGTNEAVKSEEELNQEKETVMLLKHCLAAHHGKLDYGSPIEPHIPEAYILNMADEMSAVIFKYNKRFKEIDTMKHSTTWTSGGMEVVYKASDKQRG